MLNVLAASLFALTAGALGAFAIAAGSAFPLAQVLVTTADGDVFVAGEGDDCRTAWIGASIPADWVELTCVQVR